MHGSYTLDVSSVDADQRLNNHSILKCNYANEVKSRDLSSATRPAPFALFSPKFARGFLVCRRCASWKGFFDFGARLGGRGEESFLP